jgi:hypothetical protein
MVDIGDFIEESLSGGRLHEDMEFESPSFDQMLWEREK